MVVGDGQEIQEIKELNKIIQMDNESWHYEADQRHGEEEEEDRERLNNQGASQYIGR